MNSNSSGTASPTTQTNIDTDNDTDTNKNHSEQKLATILGSTFGGLAFLALILSLFIYIHRRRRKAFLQRPEFRVDPFFSPPPEAAAPLPSLPVTTLIPYNQTPQNAVRRASSSPPSGVSSSENGHSTGSAAAVPLTSRSRMREIGQLRAAIADLHRMVGEIRGVYHGGSVGGSNNAGSSESGSSSSSRDRKAAGE
ncbi:hypothetical protein K435DRAFT_775494 [Dendrothele bispora CBS 962.96]|uniref:Uncharacterized protein n=1 Tax=Dendrothele bispora (strain CBS 962.96) TaxID=1314807 RepID=A0A4S8MJC5_DENBC|nr:hypothetical protein K435DRAFT_775494 [Dendrothele bispora CBS 962.96]